MENPEQDALLSKLAEQTKRFSERWEQQIDAFPKMRMEFFDRIVLLDGGTVALSVTLIGSLSGKLHIYYVPVMIASWTMFLISMISGLSRNWVEQERMIIFERGRFTAALTEEQGLRTIFTKSEGGSRQSLKRAYDHNKGLLKEGNQERIKIESRIGKLGAVSLISAILGFFFLLLFGSANLILAAR